MIQFTKIKQYTKKKSFQILYLDYNKINIVLSE